MMPAIYDWSGFYIGVNGGWGSSRKCWDEQYRVSAEPSLPPMAAIMRPAASSAARSAIACRAAPGCSAVKPRATGPTCAAPTLSLISSGAPFYQPIARRCLRPVHRPDRLCLQHRPALRQGRRRRVTSDRYQGLNPATNTVLDSRERNPLGRHGWRRCRIRLRTELVGSRRIRSSVHGHPHPGLLFDRWPPAPSPAKTRSVRTSISSPCASTTAGVARSSRSTDFSPRWISCLRKGRPRAGLFVGPRLPACC